MNADIRIFPAHKLEAVDMAELMNASLLRDGVIQGCGLSIEQNELQIAAGRIIIQGRLAVVSAGTVERPSDISKTQTCYLCAVCDLSAEEPFILAIYTQDQYNSLMNRVNLYKDGTFNVNEGVAAFKLADITVDPTIGVTKITQSTAFSAKNVNGMEPYQKAVTDNRSLSDSRYGYLKKRVYTVNKFFRWAIELPQRTLAAGARVTYDIDNRYGVTYTWQSNKLIKSYEYPNKTYKSKTDANGYRVDPTAFKTFANGGPQFLTPIAIAGIMLRDAATGGKNSKNCSILAWRFTPSETRIDVINTGKEAAVIRVWIQMLYAQEE